MTGLGALLVLAAAPVAAAFNDVGSGARAPGMGNAFTAVADDVYAIYYNPAGLAQLERSEVSAAYSRLYMGLSDGSDIGLSQLTAASPLRGGRWGVFGAGYQRLGLSGLYAEESLFLSTGRTLRESPRGRLMGGLNLKRLRRSFSPLSEAFAACGGLACDKGADPVLSGDSSRGLVDVDAGLLYRFPGRWSVGGVARHLLRPNVAFAGSEPLPLDLRFGASYHALWLRLAGDLHLDRDASGALGRRAILAVERAFPSLEHGQFGARGSVGVGAGEWRQLTLGLSYRVSKLQMDYAFLLPLGAIHGTQGTHRVALTVLLGGPTPEEELAAGLLERNVRLREAGRESGLVELEAALPPKDLGDETLVQVRQALEARRYRAARTALLELARGRPTDAGLARLLKRLETVTGFYDDLPPPQAPWERSLAEGLLAFLEAKDGRAVLLVSHAASLRPEDVRLDRLLARLEEATRVKALRLPAGHPRGLVEELLLRSELAYEKGDYPRVLELADDVLVLESENATALERAASIHHLLGRHEQAVAGWQRALALERDPRERQALEHHIAEARRRLGAARAEPAPAGPAPVAAPADPRVIEALYQKGVEHFARGENLRATSAFLKVLQLQPSNEPARKALERIRRTPRRPRP